MSYVPKDRLRGTDDPNISFYTTDQAFTTSEVKIDCINQFLAYSKKARLVNQDSTNALQYRQGSVSAILKPVPPNSEVLISGWESFFDIIPDPGTGKGFIEFDLVNVPDALKK